METSRNWLAKAGVVRCHNGHMEPPAPAKVWRLRGEPGALALVGCRAPTVTRLTGLAGTEANCRILQFITSLYRWVAGWHGDAVTRDRWAIEGLEERVAVPLDQVVVGFVRMLQQPVHSWGPGLLQEGLHSARDVLLVVGVLLMEGFVDRFRLLGGLQVSGVVAS